MSISASTFFDKKQQYPILIVDKIGAIGEKLVEQISNEALVIFVSAKKIEVENVVHIPFNKNVPSIPDNTYSHIFIIDEYGKISKNFITPFVEKARHDDSKLILVANINFVDEKFSNAFLESYIRAKLVIPGDIFASDYIFDGETYVNKFIKDIARNGKIDLPGDGTRETIPVFLDDVIEGVLQAGFVEDDGNKLYFLYPQNKPTLLTLAHIFQKQNPEIKIDFKKDDKKPIKTDLAMSGVYLLGEDYNLAEKVKQLKIHPENISEISRKEYQVKTRGSLSFKAGYVFVGTIFILGFFFLLPLISTVLFSIAGAYVLGGAKTDVANQQFTAAADKANISLKLLSVAKSSSLLLSKEAAVFGKDKDVEKITTKIDQGLELADTSSKILTSIGKLKKLDSLDDNARKESLLNLFSDLKTALVVYQNQREAGNIPKGIDGKVGDTIKFTSSTIDLWPEILGLNAPKKYLVLLQNNMELRPGGGFIGSYGILSLDKGKVKDFKIYDVYDADGQLKFHVEPPFAIRRYLPSVNWYLRDSNFDVDFSKNAVASAVFLNSEMNQTVDGVIGVDLSFVKNLLLATGPVKVVDYNETVTADNLFKTVSAHVENNFFPGSTQKKDFLSSLYKTIQAKLTTGGDVSYLSLMQAMTNSLYEKHLVLAFNNISLQSVFSVNGWASTLSDNRAYDPKTINDFIGINEANIGANKVNYFVSRSLSQNTSLTKEGLVTNQLTINFKNSASSILGKNGFYKSYLRVITPLNSKLTHLKIDGTQQVIVPAITNPIKYESKTFIPSSGFEVDQQNEANKTIFGFVNLVDPGKLKKIEITYELANKVNLTKTELNYDLKFFKQPGIESIPFVFTINYPAGLKLLDSSIEVTKDTGKIFFTKNIARDENFILHFTQE